MNLIQDYLHYQAYCVEDVLVAGSVCFFLWLIFGYCYYWTVMEVAEGVEVALSVAPLVLVRDKRAGTEGNKDDAHLNIYQVE